MRNAWAKLKRRTGAMVVEVLARGLILIGFAWLLAWVWRDQVRERRLLD